MNSPKTRSVCALLLYCFFHFSEGSCFKVQYYKNILVMSPRAPRLPY